VNIKAFLTAVALIVAVPSLALAHGGGGGGHGGGFGGGLGGHGGGFGGHMGGGGFGGRVGAFHDDRGFRGGRGFRRFGRDRLFFGDGFWDYGDYYGACWAWTSAGYRWTCPY
jgi:hypothetical protein